MFSHGNKFLPGQRLKQRYEDLESPYYLINNQGNKIEKNSEN